MEVPHRTFKTCLSLYAKATAQMWWHNIELSLNPGSTDRDNIVPIAYTKAVQTIPQQQPGSKQGIYKRNPESEDLVPMLN